MEDENALAIIEAINNATAAFVAVMQEIPAEVAAICPAPPPPAPPVVVPAAGPFHRTLLRSGVNDEIDLGHKDGRKYFEQATKSVFDTGSKFDVEPATFQTFINLLAVRGRDLGMLDPGMNMLIPADPANPRAGPFINSIVDYGRTSLELVTQWEATFINDQNRLSQNSKILFDLLMNSLSTKGIQRVQVWNTQFTVGGEDSGGCLFKIIVP